MKRRIILGVIVSVLCVSLVVTGVLLDKAQGQIKILAQKLDITKTELSQSKSSLDFTKAELHSVKQSLDSTKSEITTIKSENERLRAVPRYFLRDPAYKEMTDFLAADRTDLKIYIKHIYDCKHFSRDVNNSAQEKGLRCALVLLRLKEGEGHALVAFQTTDKGLIFIEPQSDREMKVAEGIKYRRDNGGRPEINDTIMDIVIVW